MDWMLIDNIQDDEKICKGACIRFYNQCALPCLKDEPLGYIVTEIYANSEISSLSV